MSTDDSEQNPFDRQSPWAEENPFSDNPYTSPNLQGASASGGAYPPASGRGMVRQVPVVSILMIVQGGLELIMGIGLVVMAVVMPLLMRGEIQGGPPAPVGPAQPVGPPPEAMSWILFGIYGFMAVVVLTGAGLHIVAGVRNYKFRGRVLGIIALIAGMVTTFMTCYCAPSAIALGVYGLMCYLNPTVGQAFDMVASGMTKEEVMQSMG